MPRSYLMFSCLCAGALCIFTVWEVSAQAPQKRPPAKKAAKKPAPAVRVAAPRKRAPAIRRPVPARPAARRPAPRRAAPKKTQPVKIALRRNCLLWHLNSRGLKRVVRQAYKGEEFMVRRFTRTRLWLVEGLQGDLNTQGNSNWFERSRCRYRRVRAQVVRSKRRSSSGRCGRGWSQIVVSPSSGAGREIRVDNGRIRRRGSLVCISYRTTRVTIMQEGYTPCIFSPPRRRLIRVRLRFQMDGDTTMQSADYCLR